MATPSVFPVSVASFRSDAFTYDQLIAGPVTSQSAKIAPSLGILKRGTVLYGPLLGVAITAATNLTTVVTGAAARVILAQDIDTGTGAAVTGIVYTSGNFLDTGIIFGANGAASDAAALWQFNVQVLTVQGPSGQLIPMMSLPATAGAIPKMASAEEAREIIKKEVEAIKAADEANLPWKALDEGPAGGPGYPDPAWAIAAYGERELSKEEKEAEKAAGVTAELRLKQQKAQEELQARQAKELADLNRKQQEERSPKGAAPPKK